MTATRSRFELRNARHSYVNRTGLTVGELRKFLAVVDEAGVSDDERVWIKDELTHEGHAHSGHLEASTRIELDGGES